MNPIVLVLVILLLIGVFPAWPYNANWGYGPSGTIGIILVILLIFMLLKR